MFSTCSLLKSRNWATMKMFDLPIKSFPPLVPLVFSGKKPPQTCWLGKHVLCGFHTELNFSFLKKLLLTVRWSCQCKLPSECIFILVSSLELILNNTSTELWIFSTILVTFITKIHNLVQLKLCFHQMLTYISILDLFCYTDTMNSIFQKKTRYRTTQSYTHIICHIIIIHICVSSLS